MRLRNGGSCAPDIPFEEPGVRSALGHVEEVDHVCVLLLGESGRLGERYLGLAAQKRVFKKFADLRGVGLPTGAVVILGLVPEPGVGGADGGSVGGGGVCAVLDHDGVGGLGGLCLVGLVETHAEHAVDLVAAVRLIAVIVLITLFNVLAIFLGIKLPLRCFHRDFIK